MINGRNSEGNDKVDIEEFLANISSYGPLKNKKRMVQKKNDNLLTFKCLFDDEHSSMRDANAYAFKKDGIYVAKCQGEVCHHSYEKLNKHLQKFTPLDFNYDLTELKELPFSKTKPMTVYRAPTGSGKTTRIITEMMKAFNQNDRIFIVLPSKTHIRELLNRYNDKTKDLSVIENSRKLFIYTAETNDDNFRLNVTAANVIITHHHYLKTKGHLGIKYGKVKDIYSQVTTVIIDEADRFLDLVHSNTLLVGGLYRKMQRFDGSVIYKKNIRSLTIDDLNEEYQIKTNILEPIFTSFQTIEFNAKHEIVENLGYLNMVEVITEEFVKLKEKKVDNFHYEFYINPEPKPLEDKIVDEGDIPEAMNLALRSASAATIIYNEGDNYKRKQIGDVNVVLTYHDILKDLKAHPRVLLTSATFTDYHFDVLDDYEIIDGEMKLKDVKRIVVLRNEKYSTNTKKQLLSFVSENKIMTLSFFGTKAVAETQRQRYPDSTMFVDNGVYSVSKRKSIKDHIQQRTVTLVGLESVMSVGYNYLEEVEGEGFEMLYFDKIPLSPDFTKYYLDDTKVKEIKQAYNLNVYLQAVGRAFRMEKEELTIIFNEIEDHTYDSLIEKLREISNAAIIEAEYTLSNLKASVYRHLERLAQEKEISVDRLFKAYLSNNQLIQERMKLDVQTETTSTTSTE